jgi:hypothetical protein
MEMRLHSGDQPLAGGSLEVSTGTCGIVIVELIALFPSNILPNVLYARARDYKSHGIINLTPTPAHATEIVYEDGHIPIAYFPLLLATITQAYQNPVRDV